MVYYIQIQGDYQCRTNCKKRTNQNDTEMKHKKSSFSSASNARLDLTGKAKQRNEEGGRVQDAAEENSIDFHSDLLLTRWSGNCWAIGVKPSSRKCRS